MMKKDDEKGIMNNRKKKVLILTADAGFGHNSASLALGRAIQLRHEKTSIFHIANPLNHPKTPEWLRKTQNNYDGLARYVPRFYRFMYNVGNTAVIKFLTEKVLFLSLYQTMKSIVQSYRPDVIINTYPLYNAPLHAVCDKADPRIPRVCVVTDLTVVHSTWFSPHNDLTVVPTEVTRDLAIRAGVPQDRVEIIGIPVDPELQLEPRTKLELREHFGWAPNLVTVLAVGSKRVTSAMATVKALNESNLPIQVVAIAGGDTDVYNQLKQTQWRIPTFVYNFVAEMPLFMRAADCVLSKSGGLIISESLAAGLPIIITETIPGQEEGNVNFVLRFDAGDVALSPEKLVEVLSSWLKDDGLVLRKKTQNARNLGRADAAFAIVERALRL